MRTFKVGDEIEANGDPDDNGFAGSWYTGRVVAVDKRSGKLTVEYDEARNKETKSRLELAANKSMVRPRAPDDSHLPLETWNITDAVDCWHEDGWWEGYVLETHDDHLVIFFPTTSEQYGDIWPPGPDRGPQDHRVRTGLNWLPASGTWARRPHQWFEGAKDYRTQACRQQLQQQSTKAAEQRQRPKSAATQQRQRQDQASRRAEQAPVAVRQQQKQPQKQTAAAPAGAPAAAQAAAAPPSAAPAALAAPPAAEGETLAAPAVTLAAAELARPAKAKLAVQAGQQAQAGQQPTQDKTSRPAAAAKRYPSAEPAQPPVQERRRASSEKRQQQEGAAGGPPASVTAAGAGLSPQQQQQQQQRQQMAVPKQQQVAAPKQQQQRRQAQLAASPRARPLEAAAALPAKLAQPPAVAAAQPPALALQSVKAKAAPPAQQHDGKHRPLQNMKEAAAEEARARGKRANEQPSKPPAKESARGKAGGAPPLHIPKRGDGSPAAKRPRRASPAQAAGREQVRGGAAARARAREARGATYLLDNLPLSFTAEDLLDLLRQLDVTQHVEARVVTVELDSGPMSLGYALLAFGPGARPQEALDRLAQACLVTPACPVPRPLLLHQPRLAGGYPWGPAEELPGHFSLDFRAVIHFAQPNSIEFDLALEWRLLLRQHRAAKDQLLEARAEALAQLLRKAARGLGVSTEGASAGDGSGCGSAAMQQPPPSRCIWLKDVPPKVTTPEQLQHTFEQFGYPQRVDMLTDAVTGLPNGHAVVWMENAQRAAAVATNLHEMVFLPAATPRPLAAEVAAPGRQNGTRHVYDRALAATLGRDDRARCKADGERIKVRVVPDTSLADEDAPLADHYAVLARAALRDLAAAAALLSERRREACSALAAEQERRYEVEARKLDDLNALRASSVFKTLRERYGLSQGDKAKSIMQKGVAPLAKK